ncbi:MAG: DUF4105 domain-containing protein [Flavobacteriaceae bacterium]|nr:DUF4105 domain-containing protein [Flavobacteriaceae bacterium]
MRPQTLLLFIALFSIKAQSQARYISEDASISILTVAPGSALNDAFGHSAFRVKDKKTHLDRVFDYGNFDYHAPNFYLNFAKGKLNYSIETRSYHNFIANYRAQNRTVRSQELDLNYAQKKRLFHYLMQNLKPENRNYLYDFFFDNCATKMKDITNIAVNNAIKFKAPKHLEEKTFRALIHDNVNRNSWGSFGIDIALGSVIDQPITPENYMFLPAYIHDFFTEARLDGHPLVKPSKTLFKSISRTKRTNFITSPLCILGCFSLFILWITYRDYKRQNRSKWVDFILFIITGVIGVFLLLLWFATDHTATAQNYNLLWAFALNVLLAPQLLKAKTKTWIIKYIKLLLIFICLMTLHWTIGIQVFAIGLIPLLIALTVRYVYLIRVLEVK